MKKNLFIFSLVLGFSMSAQKAIYTDLDGDGVIEYVLKDNNGDVLESGFYYQQKKVKTWVSYYSNGSKQVVGRFKNGQRHGNWFMYDEKGLVIFEISYKNGKKVSASQHSYASNN
jgi:antitoxin component YwqK of YwqJK toxin-antitoxin module